MSFKPLVRTLRSSDGIPIHAEFVGDKGNPCLVLIHGFTMSCPVWDNIFQDAAMLGEVCMIRYDLRGHGRSGRPADPEAYKSSLFAEDFVTVMQAFDVRRSFLVGWSYGGTIACDVAAHIGADVLLGIIYVAAIPHLMRPVFPDAVTDYTAMRVLAQQDPADVACFIRGKTEFFDGIWADAAALDFQFRSALLAPSLTQTPQVVRNVLQRHQDPERLLEAFRGGKPVLALHGDNDRLLDCEYAERLMDEHCTNLERYVVQGGDHAPFYRHQEEFVREVLRFVRRVAANRSR